MEALGKDTLGHYCILYCGNMMSFGSGSVIVCDGIIMEKIRPGTVRGPNPYTLEICLVQDA